MSAPSGTVLVVDDDPVVVLLVEESIRGQFPGIDVVTAGSGEAALARYRERPVDLVLIDLQMPGLDGAQTLARMGGRGSGPVSALMSGAPDAGEVAAASGVDLFLPKPFLRESLAEVVRRGLELAGTRRPRGARPGDPSTIDNRSRPRAGSTRPMPRGGHRQE